MNFSSNRLIEPPLRFKIRYPALKSPNTATFPPDADTSGISSCLVYRLGDLAAIDIDRHYPTIDEVSTQCRSLQHKPHFCDIEQAPDILT